MIIDQSQLPTRAHLWWDERKTLSGATRSTVADSLQVFNVSSSQVTSLDGDSWSLSCWLRSGSYTLYILGITGVSKGIVDWYFDDEFIGSHDWYSGAPVYNVVKTIPFTVRTDGYHVVKVVINGKNGSSSDFFFTGTKSWLKQASDLSPSSTLDRITLFDIDVFPNRAELWQDEATILVGTPMSTVVSNSMVYNVENYLNPPVDGSSFSHSCFLRAGVYTFSVLGVTNTDRPKVDWYFDGEASPQVSGQNWYGALTYNVIKTASVTLATNGYHTVRGVVNGKDAGSSGYVFSNTKYGFRQAAD